MQQVSHKAPAAYENISDIIQLINQPQLKIPSAMTVECILPLTSETMTVLTDHNDEAE